MASPITVIITKVRRDAGIGFTGDKATVNFSTLGSRSQSVALCSKYISLSALLLIIVSKVIRSR